MQSNLAVQSCRIKREEDRLKREIDERELKEAEELLAKKGKGKKLKEGEKLDKNAIMQVNMLTACILCHMPARCVLRTQATQYCFGLIVSRLIASVYELLCNI